MCSPLRCRPLGGLLLVILPEANAGARLTGGADGTAGATAAGGSELVSATFKADGGSSRDVGIIEPPEGVVRSAIRRVLSRDGLLVLCKLICGRVE